MNAPVFASIAQKLTEGRLRGRLWSWGFAAVACSLSVCAASAKPIVFNYQQSAKAGDVVYLQGANLAGGKVYLYPYASLGALPVVTSYQSSLLTVQIPSTVMGQIAVYVVTSDGQSDVVSLNKARPYNMDATMLAPGSPFKIFGKNLFLPGSWPVVRINGQTAALNMDASNELMLVGTVPWNLSPGPAAVTVDNANGSGPTALAGPASIVSGGSADPFGLAVGWASGFAQIASVSINPTTDKNVNPRMVGDGATDNTAALQSAVNYANSIGGATIRIPAGTYVLANRNGPVVMKSKVVIDGAGKGATILKHTGTVYPNYPIYAQGSDLIGLSDLTITSSVSNQSLSWGENTRSFLKNISIYMGSSQADNLFLDQNVNFSVTNSDFTQAALGQGMIEASWGQGAVITGNTFKFVNGKAISIGGAQDSYFANNTIIWNPSLIRSAAPGTGPTPYVTHGLIIEFMKRVTVNANSFQVQNGPIPSSLQWNCGEAILAEPGDTHRTAIVGMTTSAASTTLTDANTALTFKSVVYGGNINLNGPDKYVVAIIAGTGMGQMRDITAYNNRTMTIDRPWDVIPDTTSKYLTVVASQENVIISNNQLNQWPRGTWLYMGTANRLDIINNTYREGGGIFLRAESYAAQGLDNSKLDTAIQMNVNVVDNKVINTTRNYGSHIGVIYPNDNGTSPQGLGFVGTVVKNNSLEANQPNVSLSGEDQVHFEGYANMMFYNFWSALPPYVAPKAPGVLGTIFQGNACKNCPIVYRTGTDVFASVYKDSVLTNSASDSLVKQMYLPPGQSGSQGDSIQ